MLLLSLSLPLSPRSLHPSSNNKEIFKVSVPLVVADNMSGAATYKLVRVSHCKPVDESIELEGNTSSIQVYKDTYVLIIGDPTLRKNSPSLWRLARIPRGQPPGA